jgi:predicted benzoate:H+ symporter BenE
VWLALAGATIAFTFMVDHPFWDGKEDYLVGPLLLIYALSRLFVTAWAITAVIRARVSRVSSNARSV